MKTFETPIAEIKRFNVEDILTASPQTPDGPDVDASDGIAMDGGTCNGTMADYWEENCMPY